MSIRSLWRRKLRSALTILGVVIGTASIVLMVSLALAMNVNYENQMNQWGALSLIEVTPQDSMDDLVEVATLDDDAIAMLERIDGVEKVMPVIETSMTLTIGKYGTMRAITIMGYDQEELEALGYTVADGRTYVAGEEDVIIVGGKLADQLVKKGEDVNKTKQTTSSSSRNSSNRGNGSGMPSMGGSAAQIGGGNMPSGGGNMGAGMMPQGMDPSQMLEKMQGTNQGNTKEDLDMYNDRVTVTFETFSFKAPQGMELPGMSSKESEVSSPKPITVEIVGQLASGNSETDSVIFMPRETVLKLMQQKEIYDAKTTGRTPSTTLIESYSKVRVKVSDTDKVEVIRAQIERLGFDSEGAQDTLAEMKNMSSNIQVILMAIGAISLIVAAIGITNTLMMSIYERTKEIGVMKVIGALVADIKEMFLVEAAVIGFVGGVVGLVLCYLISFLLNTYGKDFFSGLVSTSDAYETYVSVIPLWLAGGAILFATVIGIVAGYAPAKRATAISALRAIKSE